MKAFQFFCLISLVLDFNKATKSPQEVYEIIKAHHEEFVLGHNGPNATAAPEAKETQPRSKKRKSQTSNDTDRVESADENLSSQQSSTSEFSVSSESFISSDSSFSSDSSSSSSSLDSSSSSEYSSMEDSTKSDPISSDSSNSSSPSLSFS